MEGRWKNIFLNPVFCSWICWCWALAALSGLVIAHSSQKEGRGPQRAFHTIGFHWCNQEVVSGTVQEPSEEVEWPAGSLKSQMSWLLHRTTLVIPTSTVFGICWESWNRFPQVPRALFILESYEKELSILLLAHTGCSTAAYWRHLECWGWGLCNVCLLSNKSNSPSCQIIYCSSSLLIILSIYL